MTPESSAVGAFAPGIAARISQSFARELWALTPSPSMSASIEMPTWHPTPARNPVSTVRERKSARNPNRNNRARNKSAAVVSATIPTMDT